CDVRSTRCTSCSISCPPPHPPLPTPSSPTRRSSDLPLAHHALDGVRGDLAPFSRVPLPAIASHGVILRHPLPGGRSCRPTAPDDDAFLSLFHHTADIAHCRCLATVVAHSWPSRHRKPHGSLLWGGRFAQAGVRRQATTIEVGARLASGAPMAAAAAALLVVVEARPVPETRRRAE